MKKIRQYTSTTTNAPVQFEHDGRAEGLFTRYLTLCGERAYALSFSCETCAFLFERLGGFEQSAWGIPELCATFQRGVTSIDDSLLNIITPIIPAGMYSVMLTTVLPRLVAPCSADDYFSHEQVALWGIEPISGLPRYPRTEYYRVPARPIGNAALYEFITPMMPKNWLAQETVERYKQEILTSNIPTALAISTLDVKQPATWEDDQTITKHYCFTHFLLDGHHKIFAASQLNRPISLLSFVAHGECIASPADIELMFSLRTHADEESHR